MLELTDEQPTKKCKKLSLANQIALDALKALTVHGEDASERAWRTECYERGIATTDAPDAKRKAFLRARTYLIENFYVQTRDDFYWLCRSKSETGQRDKTGQSGTCPALSPIDDRDTRDIYLRVCPVVPPMDEDFHQKEEKDQAGAFQHFIEDAAPNIPEPESLNPLEQHERLSEKMEPVDLTDAVYEIDEQEDEDAIYM